MYSGPSDAVVLKPLDDSWKGVVISLGIKPWYSKIDPYWMAASSIEEALRNNVAVGGRRMAILDNFTWGNPEKPDRLGSLLRAVQACYDFAKAFRVPFISGKDSLYNESPLGPILPTLLITAIGIIPDVRRAVSLDLKVPGDPIYLIGVTYPELGASEYFRLKGYIGNEVPRVRVPLARRIMECIIRALDMGFVKACHDLSEGGLGVAIAEMALSSGYGAEIWLSDVKQEGIRRSDFLLFSESNSRFLLEVKREKTHEFEKLLSSMGCPYSRIGEVQEEGRLIIHDLHSSDIIVDLGLGELRKAWKEGLKY